MRRSKSFGLFRLSVGKRGVGVSVGVRGARIGIGADGRARTTVSVPGTGLSYTETLGGRGRASSSARRSTGCAPALFIALFGFVALGAVIHVVETTSPAALFAAGVGVLAVLVGAIILQRRARLARDAARSAREAAEAQAAALRASERHCALITAYGEDGAAHIECRRLWVGAPEAAVREIYGAPDAIEERIMKTKVRHVLKYRDPAHSHRFLLRVTLENGAVSGWEDKGDP